MKLLIIVEFSVDSRLGEIFMIIPKKAFDGLSVMAVADLLQLPSVTGRLTFSQFLMRIVCNIH